MKIQLREIVRIIFAALVAILVIGLYVVDQVGRGQKLQLGPARNRIDEKDPDKLRSIEAVERLCIEFDIGGHLFNESGVGASVSKIVETCLIHSFSPYVEHEAAQRFLDPTHTNVFFANSPAITWHKGQLLLVARIWLDRERYEDKKNWPDNHFADNWLFTQRFDRRMRPIGSGSIIGIPAPKQAWVGDGPIEPRLISCDGRILAWFNVAMNFEKRRRLDYTVFWDMDRNVPILPTIEGGTPMANVSTRSMPRDKHWIGFVENGTDLHFVHALDPLRVMRCSLVGVCRFVQRDELRGSDKLQKGFIFGDAFTHLRGGTPFELYRWPYYVSVAHTTNYKQPTWRRYYTAQLVVLCVRPIYRVVYISNPIEINPGIYRRAPMVRPQHIDDGFIFPVGLIVETDDWLAVGVHVNDHSSLLLRIKGVKAVMDRVIQLDKLNKSLRGPPIGYIQQYIHDSLVNRTGIPMIHTH